MNEDEQRGEFIRVWTQRAESMAWLAMRIAMAAVAIGATCSYLATRDALAVAWWGFGVAAVAAFGCGIAALVCAVKANDARQFPSLWSGKYFDRNR